MIRWLCYLPLNLLMGLAVIPLAPFAVAFFSSEDKRNLTRFKWMETLDNDLTGDWGWCNEHLIGDDPFSWLNRTRWLWRNGGHAVNYGLLGCDKPTDLLAHNNHYWTDDKGHFLFRKRYPVWGNWSFELFIGWNLLGAQNGRCKFVCSPRFKSKP